MSFINFLKPVSKDETKKAIEKTIPINIIDTGESAESTKDFTLKTYFDSMGIEMSLSNKNECVSSIEKIANFISTNFDNIKGFLHYIREVIPQKSYKLSYSTSELSDEEYANTLETFNLFCEYGIITNGYVNKYTKTLCGYLSSAPRVNGFVTGGYLEIFAKSVCQQIVEKLAEEKNCDYELYHNVIVTKENKKHELDIVFRIEDKVFWSEIKSGKNFSDYDYYRRIGLFLGVNPDRHILLTAEKDSPEAIEAISWFYEYYVCNISTFKETLIQMINNAFEGGSNND